MISFARSGGTVLNQCLGCLPNTVIMSEVNPLGGGAGKGPIALRTIKQQAKIWYGINLESNGFTNNALELNKICEDRGLQLIIRDWTFVNFNPLPNNNQNPPNKLLALEALKRKCKLKPFAFVRNAIDVWISRNVSPEEFFGPYLRYVKEILKLEIPIFKYENFCENPDKVIRNICKYAGLKYNDSYKNYASFQNVNGDIQVSEYSRGIKQKEIKLLPRKRISRKKIKKMECNAEMIQANKLLGYSTSYYDAPLEKTWVEKIIKS